MNLVPAFGRQPGSEDLLELHRGAHVALDLQLARHVGGRRVLLAADDLRERLPAGADRGVGVTRARRDGDRAVADVDMPVALALDLEEVRVAHACELRRVGAVGKGVEELACSHGSGLLLSDLVGGLQRYLSRPARQRWTEAGAARS